MDEQNYGMPEQQNLQNQQIAHQQAWDQQMQAGQMAQQQMWQQQEAQRILQEQQQMAQQQTMQAYGYIPSGQNGGAAGGSYYNEPFRGQNGPITPQSKPPIKPEEKSHKGLIIAILCIVVAAGLGVGAYFLFFHKSDANSGDLADAEKVAMDYYTAWINYDEEGMKACFDGSVTITDHTQEEQYLETGYWITYDKDANVHAWEDYSEPNENLSGDHTVYCTIEANMTGQGDPSRAPDKGVVKSETFAMIQKDGKWYIARDKQPKMQELWSRVGYYTEENTEASTLAPDITPEQTDEQYAKALYDAFSTAMADETFYNAVYLHARDVKGLVLAGEAGQPFGSKSHIFVAGLPEEVNKNLPNGVTPQIYGTYHGITPNVWGIKVDVDFNTIDIYVMTGNADSGYSGFKIYPEQGDDWEDLFSYEDYKEDQGEGSSESTTIGSNTNATPESIFAELNDYSSKTADMNISMNMDMKTSYQGQDIDASVDVDMNIKGNKDVMYFDMRMNTTGSTSTTNADTDMKYWVDNTEAGKSVVYVNMDGKWYKGGSDNAPKVNVSTYTQYDPSLFDNMTISETSTEWFIQGEIKTSQLQGTSSMTGTLKNMPETVPVTITIDKAQKYVKNVEFNFNNLSMENNGITYDVSRYTIRVEVNGYTDEILSVPSDVKSSAVDMGDEF